MAFDPAPPVSAPGGLKTANANAAGKVRDALAQAVGCVQAAGFALGATLATVRHALTTDQPLVLLGGDAFESVLNNRGHRFAPGIAAIGLTIDCDTSRVQVVTFGACVGDVLRWPRP